MLIQRLNNSVNVLLIVRLNRHAKQNFLETVRNQRLIVVELDNVSIFFRQNLGDIQKFTRFIGQLYRERENSAARNQRFVN